MAEFDAERRWALDPRVAVRKEPFGALAYHFGTRRLSFLKDPTLVRVLELLDENDTAKASCRAAGVTHEREPAILKALATLAETGMIRLGADHATC
ncbi:MAG: mycofactocin biosynthesis chaperone MftB [Solirubrobacteraceae bacterium]